MALLESSSLAQIHMLSFGMKLRFGAHLAVDLFHLAAAMAANDQVCAAGFPFLPGGWVPGGLVGCLAEGLPVLVVACCPA